MINKTKSLKFNAFINGLRTIINLIFPIITFPYISRVLSVEEIGKYNFSVSIISYFILLAGLGINQYAVREGAKVRESRTEMSIFASQVFSINVVSTIVSYIALFLLIFLSEKMKSYCICILILSTQILFTTIGTEWIYSIYEEYTYITIRSIVFKIISIALLFLFVHNEGDYLIYAAISVAAGVGSNLLNFFNAKKYCDIRFKVCFNWKSILKPILVIFASNIAIQIYVNSDITMLGYISNDYSIGIYSVSTKVYSIIKNVLVAVLTVTIPRFSILNGTGNQDGYENLFCKVFNILCILSIPTVIGLILLSKNVITLIAGNNYLDSKPSLCILSITILFSLFNNLLSYCVMLPNNKENEFLKCTIVSAIVNVVLNIFFMPIWNEVGAAITTLISELLLSVMLYFESKEIVEPILKNRSILINAKSVIISSMSMMLVCLAFNYNINSFIAQTFVSPIISMAVYCIFLFITKNKIAISTMNSIIERFDLLKSK